MLNVNISTATDGTILISIDPRKNYGETKNSLAGTTKGKVYTVASSQGFTMVNGIKLAVNAITDTPPAPVK